jgi:hypothetical protein
MKTTFSKLDYAHPYLSNVVLGVMHGVCGHVLLDRFPGYFGVVLWSQTTSVLGHVKSLRSILCGPRKSLAFAIKPHAEKKLEVKLKLLLGGSHLIRFVAQLVNLCMFATSELG